MPAGWDGVSFASVTSFLETAPSLAHTGWFWQVSAISQCVCVSVCVLVTGKNVYIAHAALNIHFMEMWVN